MEFPKGYLDQLLAKQPKASVTEYSDTIAKAAKLVGQPYIVLHKRLERAFAGKELDYLMSYVRRWLHEAEKSDKPAITFNWRFKQFREQTKS